MTGGSSDGTDEDGPAQLDFYRNIRAGAETGWDFSSRWIRERTEALSDIHASEIIPVDLNCYMYRLERNMADFALILDSTDAGMVTPLETPLETPPLAPLGTPSRAPNYKGDYERYTQAAERRHHAVQTFLWDAPNLRWQDFNLTSQSINTAADCSGLDPAVGKSSSSRNSGSSGPGGEGCGYASIAGMVSFVGRH